MSIEQIIARQEEFKKGYYSFRFEYTDKDGNRRYEVACWNDGMPAKDALKRIFQHISEFPNGKLTDFIENKYFSDFLSSSIKEILEGMVEEIKEMKTYTGGSSVNEKDKRINKSDTINHLSEIIKKL